MDSKNRRRYHWGGKDHPENGVKNAKNNLHLAVLPESFPC
jgi:hypothetical protein